MKKLFLLLIFVNLLYSKSNEEYIIGISVENNDFRMIKDIRLGFRKIFSNTLIADNKKIGIRFYNNTKNLILDFTVNNEVDILTIQGLNYLQYQDKIKKSSDSFFIIRDSNNEYKQYYLISNKSSNINSIKDIKNKKLTFYFENNMIKVWLDKLSLESNKKAYKNIIKEEIEKESESLALLDVYFKKADFTIVSKLAWETMIELNPNIKKRVKIVKKSDKIFFFSVGFLKKERNKELKEIFFNLTSSYTFKEKINELLFLAKAHSMKMEKKTYLNKIEKFYSDYLKLKKQYNQ